MDKSKQAVGTDPKKKSRASSCTTCRQSKLKCNLRESYPNPCSRCVANGRECKTDASFKRVPARNRIKDLESQLDRLKRERAITKATSAKPLTHTPPTEPQSSASSPSSGRVDYDVSAGPAFELVSSIIPKSIASTSTNETRWLNVTDLDITCPVFQIEGYVLLYADALELFQHFEDRYYPQFCILEPVTSLQQLHHESPFLFWAIISVAARNHKKHISIYEVVQLGLDRIQAAVLATAIHSLLDLQGLLLVCAYPYYTSCEMQPDHSLTLLGSAISAAKQLGLDKTKDELSFQGRTFQDAVAKHSREVRQLTWIKCFELDVQLSCWHGHSPTMATPYIIRTVTNFCSSLSSLRYAAIVSVHIELARGLAVLEDALHAQNQSLAGLVYKSVTALSAAKQTWQSTWAVDAELELLTAKLYLYGIRLAGLQTEANVDDILYVDVLQSSLHAAVDLAILTTNLNSDALANAETYGFSRTQHPLPGYGKHRMRSAFFAGVVLLKYLDGSHERSAQEKESARNAFGKIYQMFSTCASTNMVEIANAARILETAGRVVRRGCGKMQSRVTTRMGASLVDDAVYLASQMQALDLEQPADILHQDYTLSNPITSLSMDELNSPEPLWDLGNTDLAGFDASLDEWENGGFHGWHDWLMNASTSYGPNGAQQG